ncbi:helix-turn-helix domain-containing protein [Planococcus sp. CAU13]|uniref:helix-turn-helix domain-containing protein n=1 Tax=Planococcus sp. CAU13 TaxID=1541197 RepID=UPI000689AA7C|nr:helix-turn-helix domain-containing protein [Planococcus sp. CAU13]
MMDKQKLGFEIKRLRKLRKMTQIQLAKDICNQSEISRIEAGDCFPSLDVLYLISNRLNVPITIFFNSLSFDEMEEIKLIQKNVWNFSQTKKYEELLTYLNHVHSTKVLFSPEMEKFLLWQQYISLYALKRINGSYCLAELSSLLRKNTIGMDRELDFHIKISVANILAETKEYNKSLSLYKDILKEKIETPEANKVLIKTHYNYGKLLFLKKEYLTAYEVTTAGIELSLANKDMSLIGQLHFQKAAIMEELDYPFKSISLHYRKAAFFFEELGLYLYSEILTEKKGAFLS